MDNNIVTKRTQGEWKPKETNKKDLPFELYNTSDNCTLGYVTTLTKTGSAEANAVFICKAVNNYDSLLEALKLVVEKNLFNADFIGMDTAQKAIEKTI